MKAFGTAALAALISVFVASTAVAQTGSFKSLFGGGGVVSGRGEGVGGTLMGGAAIERRFENGLAANFKAVYLIPVSDATGYGYTVLSPNLAYHARSRSRFTPFVTGGYSLLFGSAPAHGLNVGAGIEFLPRNRKTAVRLEIRDQIFDWGGPIHFVAVRVGATLR